MKKFSQWLLAKNNKYGYTIVELLVVITILALLIGLTIPGLAFLRQHAIESELDKLQIICQLLQKQAINTGRKEYLTFHVFDHSYFYCSHSEKLASNVYFGIIKGVNGPPANPKEPITVPITFPKQRITFYPNGMISAGTMYLTNQDRKTLLALTVPVSQVSFIRKYRYQNGAWLYLP